jgi:integrase-like protein
MISWKPSAQADRSALRELLHTRPDLSLKDKARLLKRSYSWAKDWAKRLAAAPAQDLEVLHSRSRARQTPPADWDPLVLLRLEQLRLSPPEGLQRTPGPKALLYYLPRDADLQQRGCRLPKSTSTIWKMLKHLGLLPEAPSILHREEPLCEPLEEVQVDFKDPGVPADPSEGGKKQHVVEVCNFVDAGTSVLLAAKVQDNFHAQTAAEAVIAFLREQGCPRRFSFDHDPRWVGGPGGWDFPSALRRFLAAVGVEVRLCPPHQPQKNGFVERYHRSYKSECLRVHQPQNLEEVKRVTQEFQQHDNWQRPHQGRACGNRPPRQVFETLPALPALPETVQADRWLARYHHRVFVRLVGSDGCVAVNREDYSLSTHLAGQKVALVIDAPSASFDVWVATTVFKRLPIKGVVRGEMPLEQFITLTLEQAASEEQRRLALKARFWQRSLWDPTP